MYIHRTSRLIVYFARETSVYTVLVTSIYRNMEKWLLDTSHVSYNFATVINVYR